MKNTAGDAPLSAPQKELTFEQAVVQLEELIRKLEEGNAPLEEMVKSYEEGMRLSKFCADQLDAYEAKMEVLQAGKRKAESDAP